MSSSQELSLGVSSLATGEPSGFLSTRREKPLVPQIVFQFTRPFIARNMWRDGPEGIHHGHAVDRSAVDIHYIHQDQMSAGAGAVAWVSQHVGLFHHKIHCRFGRFGGGGGFRGSGGRGRWLGGGGGYRGGRGNGRSMVAAGSGVAVGSGVLVGGMGVSVGTGVGVSVGGRVARE